MEDLEQKIQQWLIVNYSSPARFVILRVLGKTWEKEMKEKSKIPVFAIDISFPPNFFFLYITLLENNHFQASNIGIIFQALFEEPDNKDADEEGFVYKFGWCKGTIIGEYLYSDSQLNIISITPVEFKYEKMPEWVEERTVSKTFQENKNDFDLKYKGGLNCAEKMFP
jgi:hypothetical protein